MLKRHAVTLVIVSDIPGVGGNELAAAMTQDMNERGILIESLLIEEVKG